MSQLVWFHGTNSKNASAIERNGFKAGTWFARHLEDAVIYGGDCIFFVRVVFKHVPLKWQVCSENAIPASSIIKRIDVRAEFTPPGKS